MKHEVAQIYTGGFHLGFIAIYFIYMYIVLVFFLANQINHCRSIKEKRILKIIINYFYKEQIRHKHWMIIIASESQSSVFK